MSDILTGFNMQGNDPIDDRIVSKSNLETLEQYLNRVPVQKRYYGLTFFALDKNNELRKYTFQTSLIEPTIDDDKEEIERIDKELQEHVSNKAIHKTSEEIRSEIVDADIPDTIARVQWTLDQINTAVVNLIGGASDEYNTLKRIQTKIEELRAEMESQLYGDDGGTVLKTLEQALKFLNQYKDFIVDIPDNFVSKQDIVDNLTTDDPTKVLSAKQGKVLSDTLTNYFESAMQSIRTETDRAINAENRIETKLDKEIDRSIKEDQRIDAKLDAEIKRSTDEDLRIDSKLDAEIERSTNEDIRIDNKLDSEINRSTAEDDRLDQKIDAETTRATTAESNLNTKIETETDRAEGEESRIEAKLDNEITRSTNKDTEHDNRLQALEGQTHEQNTDLGTTNSTFQLKYNTGNKIKHESDAISVRNAADTDYVNFIAKNATFKGDLLVEGQSFVTEAETVEIKDNLLLLNKGEVGAGVTKGIAGLEIDRGTEPNYFIIFDESDNRFKVGVEGDLWNLALRESDDNMLDGYFISWNSKDKILSTTNIVNESTPLLFGRTDYKQYSGNRTDPDGNYSSYAFISEAEGNHLYNFSGSSNWNIDTDKINFRFWKPLLGTTFKRASDNSEVLYHADIINNLTSGGTNKVLSAEQGKLLQNSITSIQGSYLPLSGGTMTGSIRFPIGKGIACGDVAGTAAYVVLRTWNANNSTRMYVGTVNFPTYISSTASDLIHDRNGSSYLLWDSYNLLDPAKLSADQTFTGLNTFTKKITVGSLTPSQILLDPSKEVVYRYASTEVSRGYSISLGTSNNIRKFTYGGYYSASKNDEYAYLSLPTQSWDSSSYKFYADKLAVPKVWSLTDGTVDAITLTNSSTTFGRESTPLRLRGDNTDLIYYRGNNTYKIWDKFNLSDPATLSGNNTFTGNNTFQAGKFNVGPFGVTSSGSLLSNISSPAGSSWSRSLIFRANNDIPSSLVFGGYNSVDDTSIGYVYIGIGDINYQTAQYKFYANSLRVPYRWSIDGPDGAAIIWSQTSEIVNLGRAAGTTKIRSGNTDLIHTKGSTEYIIWDKSNLPNPASTTDLTNYLPLAGGTLTGQLTIKQSVDIKLRLQSTDTDNYCIIQAINAQASQLGVLGYAGDKWAIGHGGTYYEIWDKYNLTDPVTYTTNAYNHATLKNKDGQYFTYIKAGTNGLLPHSKATLASGGSGSLGTSDQGFNAAYINNLHTNKVTFGDAGSFIDNQSGDSSHIGIGFYTSQNAACPVYVGSLCVSDGYANSAPNIPANGIYSKGIIYIENGIGFRNSIWTNDLTPNRNYSGYLQVLDAYDAANDGGPNNYGTVLQINSKNSHWANQLWFSGGTEISKKGLYYRHMAYNQTEYGDWIKLVTTSDLNSYLTKTEASTLYYPYNGRGYLSITSTGKPVMSNNQGYAVKDKDGNEREVLWMGTDNTLNLGNTSQYTLNILNLRCTTLTHNGSSIATQSWSNNTFAKTSHTHTVNQLSNLGTNWSTALTAAVYTRPLSINGTNYNCYAPGGSSSITLYAPTSAGTSGQILQSTGGVPEWVNASSVVGNFVSKSGDTMTGALTMSSRRNNIVVDVVGGAGQSWDGGAGALSIQVPNDSGQTPLLLARRSGATINTTTLSERLLDMALLDTGTIFKVGMSGVNALELEVTSFTNKVGIGKLFGKTIATTDQIPSIPSISISNSGSGNAVTSITANGHTLNVTKGATYLTSHQTIYDLTFQAGTFSAKTFDPNGAAAIVNIPTNTSHLTNDSGFITSSALNGYATQSWANGQFAPLKNYFVTSNYASIATTGNEMCIGSLTSGNSIINVNYRNGTGTTSPSTWYWRAGSSTSWANAYWGNLYMNDNLVATQTWSNSQYPLKTGAGASGTWNINISGNASTASAASKLGSTTIGGSAKPIYLSSGTPTACSATVGSATVPVYMKAGTITQCSTTLGVSITGNAATATNASQLGGTAAASYVKANDNISRLTNDSGYTTQEWVNGQGFLTSDSLLDKFVPTTGGYIRNSDQVLLRLQRTGVSTGTSRTIEMYFDDSNTDGTSTTPRGSIGYNSEVGMFLYSAKSKKFLAMEYTGRPFYGTPENRYYLLGSNTEYHNLDGYQRIGDIMIQWGYFTVQGNSTRAVNFPVSFTNTVWSVTGSWDNTATGSQENWGFTNYTSSGFTIINGDGSSRVFHYIAIGPFTRS